MKTLINSWSDKDDAFVKKAIKKFLLSRKFDSFKKTNVFEFCNSFKDIDNMMGFAYYQFNGILGYYIDRDLLFLDDKHVYHVMVFSLGEDHNVYAVCENNKGELIYLPI